MDPNWLFHPESYSEFERRYFQREVLLIKRNTPGYFDQLLSVDDLDTIFATHGVSHPEVSLVKHGADILKTSYTHESGRIDPVKAARLFSQGATLIFTQLQSRLPKLGQLCADLETLFSQRMQTNIYLTPANAQGFPPHWDTHCVFVLQISGTKQWTIYDNRIALPLKGQMFNPEADKPGAVSLEFELEPGDMLYVPRGMMHSAKASTVTSLHVTTGMVGHNWTDLMLQAVAAAAIDSRSLRESLPLGWARPDSQIDLASLYKARVDDLFAHIRKTPPPFEELAPNLTASYASLSRGILKRTLDATMLSAATVVRVTNGSAWNLHQDGDNCFVTAGSRELQLPARVLPILQFLTEHATGRIADLPKAIDEAGKIVLVRRLITEGLLECA